MTALPCGSQSWDVPLGRPWMPSLCNVDSSSPPLALVLGQAAAADTTDATTTTSNVLLELYAKFQVLPEVLVTFIRVLRGAEAIKDFVLDLLALLQLRIRY
jgi:hypothetical protein